MCGLGEKKEERNAGGGGDAGDLGRGRELGEKRRCCTHKAGAGEIFWWHRCRLQQARGFWMSQNKGRDVLGNVLLGNKIISSNPSAT